MLRFKKYVPYYLNDELLSQVKLPLVEDDNHADEEIGNILYNDLLSNIIQNDCKCEIEEGLLSHKISVEKDTYHIKGSHFITQLLEIFLKHGQNDCQKIRDIYNGIWYFFDEDELMDEPHWYYRFFITSEFKIVCTDVRLSSTFGKDFAIPENLLITDSENDLFRNEDIDRKAYARLMYDKWINETNTGKLFRIKENILREETDNDEPSAIAMSSEELNFYPLIEELREIRKEISFIRNIIYLAGVIAFAILIYFIFD